MNTCILHLGTSKTGTTSLQTTLRTRLSDPHFCWLSGDGITGPFELLNMFAQDPHQVENHLNSSAQRQKLTKTRLLREFDRRLQVAVRENRTPILSSEYAYRLSPSDFTAIREFLTQRGFVPRICVYLRPHHDWAESSFQQNVKNKKSVTDFDYFRNRLQTRTFDHLERLTTLHEIFGSQNVDAFVFNPKTFPNRCSVMHFCTHYGIAMSNEQVLKSNGGLNRSILSLLIAWILYGKQASGRLQTLQRDLLLGKLRTLKGPRFEVHEDLIRDRLDGHESQRGQVERILGQEFPPSFRQRNPNTAIQSMEELLDYPQDVMSWLADATGKPPLPPGQGLEKARCVAEQMQSLRLFSNLSLLAKTIQRRVNLSRISHESGV